MQYRHIIYEKQDKIAKITLNRPEVLNAMDSRMVLEISHALQNADKDKKIRVVIIRGSDRAFCVGSDLDSIKKKIKTLYDQQAYFESGNRMVKIIEQLTKPVIAVVSGYALAGGFDLMTTCDFAIATENAVMGDQHINFGLVGPGGGAAKVSRIVGIKRAKEIILMGKRVSGKEAETMGLVNRAVPPEELDSTVAEFVANLIDKSPTAIRISKALINRAVQTDFATAEELEVALSLLNVASEDYQKSIKAFGQKKRQK